MTKLSKMVGCAFVAMSLLTGFARTPKVVPQDRIIRADDDQLIRMFDQ
jgi:hypothetical protein